MSQFVQKVDLRFRCKHLKNLDIGGRSDPFLVLNVLNPKKNSEAEIGRTECIKNNLNPVFMKEIRTDYRFEETQHLRVVVYDKDVTCDEFIGKVDFTMAEVMTTAGQGFKATLTERNGKGKCGELYIDAEAVSNVDGYTLAMRFSGTKLDKKDLFGKSDPYLVFNQVKQDGKRYPVHKTEIVKKTLNPIWKEFTISLHKLCGGDLDRTLFIECYDWDAVGKDDLIGTFTTTARCFFEGTQRQFQLIYDKKGKLKESGTINLDSIEVVRAYSFADYVLGGMEISLVTSVDFTGSNGNPKAKNSLHYIDGMTPNCYMEAIMSVGSILLAYDTDKLVQLFGFGAKLPDGTISHLFPLNGNVQNPSVLGVEGMIAAYQNTLTSVSLWGPTNFAPTIKAAAETAASFQLEAKQHYLVLLIITDGVISDMSDTINEIVKASALPMSIIIVGVGNADFSAMDVLDGDGQALKSNGKVAVRDIVQFVAFEKFRSQSCTSLASAVLAEVPSQVESYMRMCKLTPMILPEQLVAMQQQAIAQQQAAVQQAVAQQAAVEQAVAQQAAVEQAVAQQAAAQQTAQQTNGGA